MAMCDADNKASFLARLSILLKPDNKLRDMVVKESQVAARCWVIFLSANEDVILTLKAPRKNASEIVVCWSRQLQIIA